MKPGTFVIVQVHELPALLELGPEATVLLAIRLLSRSGSYATRRSDVQSVTGISDRRWAQRLLERLKTRGLIEYCGHPKDPWGRFRLVGQLRSNRPRSNRPQQAQPTAVDSTALHLSGRSYGTIDLDPLPPSLSESPRAHARTRATPKEGGREGGEKNQLLILVRELWPNVAPKVAEKNIAGLRVLVDDDVPDDELAAYLRYSATDPTLAQARHPLAAACTQHRVEAYFARRARARRPAKERRQQQHGLLTPAENAALGREALSLLRRPKH